jgi:LmbE family N-acetylglucosaminyl deacetylase
LEKKNKMYMPESAMAIVAHPDDIEFGCAGTLITWAKKGARISYVLVTSGDVGIADPNISKSEAIEIRENEAKNAAKIAGATEIIFMREPDGMVVETLALRKKIVREIRRFKPEVIISGDPSILFPRETYINHPDHRAVAAATLAAAFPAAGQPNLFEEIEEEEGITAHKPRKVYISTWGENANTWVNITGAIETKIDSLKAHVSQIQSWDPSEYIKERGKTIGKGKEMNYAEEYRVITLENDESWEKFKGDPIKKATAQKNESLKNK